MQTHGCIKFTCLAFRYSEWFPNVSWTKTTARWALKKNMNKLCVFRVAIAVTAPLIFRMFFSGVLTEETSGLTTNKKTMQFFHNSDSIAYLKKKRNYCITISSTICTKQDFQAQYVVPAPNNINKTIATVLESEDSDVI